MRTIKNTDDHYGEVAIIFHWVMFVLIAIIMILGIIMVRMPISLQKLILYGFHKKLGILTLFLVIGRLIWRWMNVLPHLPDHVPKWQELAARTMHRAFYVFMFTMPITGWLLTSSAGLPVSFFGLFVLPDLISPSKSMLQALILMHKWIGYGLIGAILIHTGAALRHHFYGKDDVLRRMMP